MYYHHSITVAIKLSAALHCFSMLKNLSTKTQASKSHATQNRLQNSCLEYIVEEIPPHPK